MGTLQSNVVEPDEIFYPESDGKPMAENTLQYRWIVTLIENLDAMLPDFVGGDLFWYPVKGHPEIVISPDLLVAFGRPKGDRPSYKNWAEEGVVPQVVGEVWSPSNTPAEKRKKLAFYEQYGVQEYYAYDPDAPRLQVYLRRENRLEEVSVVGGFVSPLLGIRFHLGPGEMEVYTPDGRRFERLSEVLERQRLLEAELRAEQGRAEAEFLRAEAESERTRAARKQAELARKQSEIEFARAETERAHAETERARAEAAEAQLRALQERLRALGLS
jgi:Uma2 family endonuclease